MQIKAIDLVAKVVIIPTNKSGRLTFIFDGIAVTPNWD
jgi:hypothetical protein